jgi:hypothetical protein
MSRVSYAMMNPGGDAGDDRGRARGDRRPRQGAAEEAGSTPATRLRASVIVCNPVMHHLLLGIDPVELGQAPLRARHRRQRHAHAREISTSPGSTPGARVYLLPCIAGHVGADAAAVALSEAPGAQTEMTLRRRCRHQCRDPAGRHRGRARLLLAHRPGLRGRADQFRPARRPRRHRARSDRPGNEGAALQGHRLDLWSTDPGFAEATKDTGVTGICGSGIIEAVAEMRMAGLIDASGLIGSAEATGSPAASPRGAPCLPAARRRRGGPRILRHAGRYPRHPAGQIRALRRRALLMDKRGATGSTASCWPGPSARISARNTPWCWA